MTRRRDLTSNRIARTVEGDDVRNRRANAPWLDDSMLGPGLTLKDGRIQIDLEPASFLRLTKRGKLEGVVHDLLTVTTGSPRGIRLDPSVMRGIARAEATIAALRAENAALRERIAAQEQAAVTLESDVVGLNARVAALEVL